ncbi:MAG: diaminopimelate decarboxylase [Thermodesulfobacteriaceae bacterium]|nr:diaminopimelate decarboxylase [Thermodesulfobacteriaceae bacterium]MCX8041769.1 diaminopimelate decarboxylase [Thermodesulfobacteriaceae bacterium]MDW8136043.1 diaminopimelate decarboxylase [Thermodesulfobacterium sp.]
MHYFGYKKGVLHCENVSIIDIVKEVGTPVYIYSSKTIKRHYKVFSDSFKEVPVIICYSVKANSNIAILALLKSLGAGADVVSGGELKRALRAGISPQKIVFSGVGKTEEEIEMGLKAEILMFNVESLEELQVLGEIAKKLKKVASFALRVNPNVDSKTHPYIATGLSQSKFGIPEDLIIEAYKISFQNPYLKGIGLDVHIGSQLTSVEPFIEAIKRLKKLWKELVNLGFELKYLDIGGGLGIVYGSEEPPLPQEYAEAIIKEIKDLGAILILEPGRVIVGNAGILVTKVLYTKTNWGRNFVIVDAGMNDLIRPALYQAYHKIVPVEEKLDQEEIVDVVGPVCESGDFFARERKIPSLRRGDLIAIMSAGAYSFVMSSNYNSRPRPAEVLVEGEDFYLIRRRETIEDLLALESIPHGWNSSGI